MTFHEIVFTFITRKRVAYTNLFEPFRLSVNSGKDENLGRLLFILFNIFTTVRKKFSESFAILRENI